MIEGMGDRLKKALKDRGISQRQFCPMVGISEPMLSSMIHGNAIPRFDVAADIAKALDISLDYLAFGNREAEEEDACMARIKTRLDGAENLMRRVGKDYNLNHKLLVSAVVGDELVRYSERIAERSGY